MKEKISALLDGEVNDLEHERALRALGSDPALSATWERYHLAGTAIRRELEVMVSPDLANRIQERLRDEQSERAGVSGFLRSRRTLKLGAGFAIAASVAAVAILNLPPVLGPGAAPVARQSPGISDTAVADARQARPEQQNALNPYLMQHGEFTPAAGMNGMLSYVRVVGRHSAISEGTPAQK
jgi:negative regulator of sigma E activity